MSRKQRKNHTYCPSCGRIIEESVETCPYCGMWIEHEKPADLGAPPDNPQNTTNSIPRLNSSLPSEEEVKASRVRDNTLHVKYIVVAVIACVVLVCGSILLIFHPWNPNSNSFRDPNAQETAQDGSLNALDSLSAQDSNSAENNAQSSADSAQDSELYSSLRDAYRQMAEAKSKLEQSLVTLNNSLSQTKAKKQEGLSTNNEIETSVEALVSRLDDIAAENTKYEASLNSLKTAADSLKAYSDALQAAWVSLVALDGQPGSIDQVEKSVAKTVEPSKSAFEKSFKAIVVPSP